MAAVLQVEVVGGRFLGDSRICSNFSILVKHIFSILELWLCDKAEALFFRGCER